jgi:tetratricopeptide (TPR) repeat protein
VLTLLDEMEAQAHQRGDREMFAAARTTRIHALVERGSWQEALALATEADQLQASPWARSEAISAVFALCEQGAVDAARTLLDEYRYLRDHEQGQQMASFAACEARLLRAENHPAEALAAAERGLSHRQELTLSDNWVRPCLVEALEAALELDDHAKAEQLLALADGLQPGELTPSLLAQRHRFHARLAGSRDPEDVVHGDFARAEKIFAQHGLAFYHAAAQVEHAEWLTTQGRWDEAKPLCREAREAFERLEAKPWLQRVDSVEVSAQSEGLPDQTLVS